METSLHEDKRNKIMNVRAFGYLILITIVLDSIE